MYRKPELMLLGNARAMVQGELPDLTPDNPPIPPDTHFEG
jgi:hypothetical protein